MCQHNHNRVSMVVADDMVRIWRQDICNHRDDIARTAYVRSAHCNEKVSANHYNDVIMGAMASQITGVSVVYSTVYSGSDQRKNQSSASLAFASSHKGPVMRKNFPFDDVIVFFTYWNEYYRVLVCLGTACNVSLTEKCQHWLWDYGINSPVGSIFSTLFPGNKQQENKFDSVWGSFSRTVE